MNPNDYSTFMKQQQPGEDPSNLQEVNLNQENMFQETAAYIILYVQKVGEVGSSHTQPQKRNIEKKESIYFWFGKRVSKVSPSVLRII